MKPTPARSAECGMRNGGRPSRSLLSALLFTFILHHSSFVISAYPPAPHHLFYGLVRDEFGTPLNSPGAEVFLETASGVQIKTQVIPGLEPGVNYKLAVPMDAGIASDLYKPTALRPTVPFRIKVKLGDATYLPIEMTGDFSQLGQPGRRTLLNLTLGEDTDGDGLPDAWERLINPDISKVNPGIDADGDGLTNLQEYLAGTYAFDPNDGFTLAITGLNNGRPVMRFLAIRGRTYTLLGSSDLKTWVPVGFRIPAEGATAERRGNYQATDVRPIELEAEADSGQPAPSYFKLLAQ